MDPTNEPISGFSFTAEENEHLTRVGRGTLMGDLFRQYWIPVVPVSMLVEPGGQPRRVRLLGEDLVLFRTWSGEVGLIGAYCSHRLAPLFFGRIEDDGLRCPYHGWKYAPGGKCLETPNVPAEQRFMDTVRHPAYPCVEYGGVIWTYMGPAAQQPPLPEFEFAMVPEEQRAYSLYREECNYLQVLEGGIDPTHVMWLHSPYDLSDDDMAEQHQGPQQKVANRSGTRTPLNIDIVDTAGGFVYGTRRPLGEGSSIWRVNQFILPFYTMPPGADARGARAYIPIDDESCVKWVMSWYPTRAIMESTKEKRDAVGADAHAPATSQPFGFILPKANKSNDYLIDWNIHKDRRLGIVGVNLQDICMTENEGPGPILDRTKEKLCSGDLSTVKARRLLLRAARELRDRGNTPPGVADPTIYRVRGASKLVPDSANWLEEVREAVTV